ncbi:MAG: ribosome biogenesis GTPase Der [Phycisphaerales bacterium]|nr:ribosome biogenesis GTPase Der [Phycisphaerales bacterium]
MKVPIVTIVGRPNVGKSSLLNALAGQRISIVDPRAGITRDRVSVTIDAGERRFELIDTGGVGIVDEDKLEASVDEQIHYALECADLILFLVDVRDGFTPLDQRVAELLRPLGKPVIVVVNKVDVPTLEPSVGVFGQFGYGDPLAMSCKHMRGRSELLEAIFARLGDAALALSAPVVMKLAIVGKRNAGKSTLVNALAGEERMIVSETPGTTRDAVDVRFERDGRSFIAIDTAGVRKKKSMDDIDFYSHTRALESIGRADVVMHLIDATSPVSEVDKKLARAIIDATRPVMLAVNKWDLVGGRATSDAYVEYLSKTLQALDFAPIVCMAAESGYNVEKAVEVALSLHEQSNTRVGTGALNRAVREIVEQRNPSTRRGGKLPRIYYATQTGVAPPTIVLFCSRAADILEDYRRYFEDRLRDALGFTDIPIRLYFRERERRALPEDARKN